MDNLLIGFAMGAFAGLSLAFVMTGEWHRKCMVDHGAAHYDSITGKYVEHAPKQAA